MKDEDRSTVPLVALRGLWKVFESVTVLRGIDFEIHSGEVLALLGGNGSGKSTIVKIISGAHRPTAGTIEIDGTPKTFSRPSDAHAQGIYMVPQEPHIFPNLSVLENLVTGLSGDAAENAQLARKTSVEIGLNVDFNAPAGRLSIANQQLVEIVRGLLRKARVLILDEPTSSLTRREVASLAEQMRKLSAQGIGILFISHRLHEVLEFSDTISVLRDGHFVLSQPADTLSADMLVEAMLPADYTTASTQGHDTPSPLGETCVLEVSDLCGQVFQDVSFKVQAGEVVGISGVVGSGRTELAEAIYGIDRNVTGSVIIAGTPTTDRTPRISQEMGLSYVPEDRHAHGIFLALPSAHTISSGVLSLSDAHYMNQREEVSLAARFVDRLRIKVASPLQLARTLSGGNQQKVVLAKALASEPRVIILDEPTRGIDARARQDVYRIILELVADGVGIVVISSEVGEIAEISDRILIMKRGRLRELPPGVRGVEQISAAAFDTNGDVLA
ncbi:sugar ABC transporter ATP-binding protein [Tropicimonas sp. TH_r6]|uniref:sugar ABC transporter ATP-binding protein n=1 Tax=Tropicimonas sp. TH_r6 TaxID=3082085 RepID=UPI0029552908|nr:sugar ABC transporter ATP-binding protein [Tropicimonas sp. TH_r6]MDV7143992.1 sugar ABC transporter ATP-binding protein [Tropicimonas sp. TH_r6]